MYFLVYSSSATIPFSNEDLIELLATSRSNNQASGITGMLLFKNSNFLQVLEGEKEAVYALYNKIERDTRHRNILVLYEGEAEERQFPEWQMAFRHLRSDDFTDVPGFIDFFTPGSKKTFFENPTLLQRLLLKFKEIM